MTDTDSRAAGRGPLAQRVALVTGASRGIGRSIALLLAQRGAYVVAGARGTHAQEVTSEIQAAGGVGEAATLDVTDRSNVEQVVGGIVERHGAIDILVSNAGITRDQLVVRMKPGDWDAVIATNLTAAFTCMQAVARPMMKQRRGRIIAIGSVVGDTGNVGQANYAASKAGLVGLSKSMARELAARGVTVNLVSPGLIDTDMTRQLDEKVRDTWAAQVPLGRLGTPEDVAGAVCFLASDEASYITGQVLSVNGGMFM